MPQNIPIYDNLLSKIESSNDTITEKTRTNLINSINKYRKTHELLFAIIRCYQLNNSNNITNLPFYCKYLKTKKGYKFDIENIPDKLIRVMVEFYKLHEKSIDK